MDLFLLHPKLRFGFVFKLFTIVKMTETLIENSRGTSRICNAIWKTIATIK